ncbi:hypothetical protein CSAL01_10054 [Colletotrichum salicis]|uniref:Uncharacterized protein n=1 Tax=Colletotrichum salicis TaxID=1209931 RepID=A0A135UUJ2_9PEZI|nr:hypothetical protein CSAL01_10054 [Colletotrichum salicis]
MAVLGDIAHPWNFIYRCASQPSSTFHEGTRPLPPLFLPDAFYTLRLHHSPSSSLTVFITHQKSSTAKKSGSIAAFFVRVDRNEALALAIKVQPKAPKTPEAPQHAEPSPTSQLATPPASSMPSTSTDSKCLLEEENDVIDLVTTDKVVLPAQLPQTVAIPFEPQPLKPTTSTIQPLVRIRHPDIEKGTPADLFCTEIIDDLVSFTKVCRNLWHFELLFLDDGYHPDNHAKALTDDDILELAAACPNLRTVKLPATTQLGHRSLIASCQHCPGLKHLEITTVADNKKLFVHEKFFDELMRHPSWAPQLKKSVLYAHCDSLPGSGSRSLPEALASVIEDKTEIDHRVPKNFLE